ncbi:two-component system response regulator NarL [Pleionea sp. CnH1-48]|uniref:two-component system response regulator NarL n=1 Tax=Pleionea sp. CnH1-48 TaxID=2954494 RepID=UPI0020974AE7|nr:two-component system response regulator NarL [Pleionea sp. CnH1-48]MCO7225633.1 two-component system response regulator NarL [Pleionea sp. CnH1-48]
MTESATIYMVDDHPLFRKGVKQLIDLDTSLHTVGEASSGEEAVNHIDSMDDEPDVILLDLNMGEMSGLETLKKLRDKGVTSKIIMLTVSDNDEDVIHCIRSGADGYLLKDMEPEDIMHKLKEATSGQMVISESLRQILTTALRESGAEKTDLISTLTNREYEILDFIAHGLSNKMIARNLGISEGTVKVHVKHLLKKLNMRSRVEAAVWMVNQKSNRS